jgi:hypothetical protein
MKDGFIAVPFVSPCWPTSPSDCDFDRFVTAGALELCTASEWGGFRHLLHPCQFDSAVVGVAACPQALASLSRTRRVAGNILLVLTFVLWSRSCTEPCRVWLTATPVSDPLIWKKQFARMANYAACILGLGGTLSLWLKGVRMPPCRASS